MTIPAVTKNYIELPDPGTLVLSRPLHELWLHVQNCELPSWQLIARAISTLFLALFRGHFCDGILLLRPEAIYHSFHGKIEEMPATGRHNDSQNEFKFPFYRLEDGVEFNASYPHLMEAALYLSCKKETPSPQSSEGYKMKERLDLVSDKAPPNTIVSIPDFSRCAEISAQTMRAYFANAYDLAITDREVDNTLATLIYSDRLQIIDVQRVHALYS